MKFVLASQSPRRRQLLQEQGYQFETLPPPESAEDAQRPNERPSDFVCRLAQQKATSIAELVVDGLIIACDTVAECQGEILGKPAGRSDANRMLRLLRGRPHRVLSGLCLWQRPSNRVKIGVAVTELVMDPISDQQLDQYLDGGAWQGKAGAFGYQDGLDWIRVITGSESNVVGLPLELLEEMLSQLGIAQSRAR